MKFKWQLPCYALGLLLMQTLAACTSQVESPAVSSLPPGSKNQIVLAVGGESERGFDPTLGWGQSGSSLFHSTLLRRDENLNIVKDLATDYSLSNDKKVWRITLRQDAKFSDGKPVTAEDVAYTFNKAAQHPDLTQVKILDQAVATDKYKVELRLKKPNITFINRLTTLGIVPKHAHNTSYANNPIGSGPYKFVQWDKGKQLVVEANPNYYGQSPEIKRLVFLFMVEDAALAAAKAGQVQIAAVSHRLAIQPVAGMKLHAVKSVDYRGLMFPVVPNTGKKTPQGHPIGNNVTADLAIRQAVNYALDRKVLVEANLQGFGSPAYNPARGLPWEQPKAAIQDAQPDKAREILTAAGWNDSNGDGIVEKDGLKAEFKIIYPIDYDVRQSLAHSVADMLEEAGIQATVEGKSWDDISAYMHSNVIVFGGGSHDPSQMYDLYHSSSAQGDTTNAGYYANPTVDRMLDQAMKAASESEAIPLWQAAQWNGQTGFTTKGDAAWAWLVNLDHTYFVSTCLNIGKPQVEPQGRGWPITANITQWKWVCN